MSLSRAAAAFYHRQPGARSEADPAGEPLETLKAFSYRAGQWRCRFWPEPDCPQQRGDPEWEMKWKSLPAARRKPTGQVKATIPRLPSAQQQATVAIEWQGQQFTGNNQQVLLEQLEQQGIRVTSFVCGRGSAAAAASGWKREK